MVENPTFVSPITGASGTGTIVLDGRDLDDLAFEMAIEAEGDPGVMLLRKTR